MGRKKPTNKQLVQAIIELDGKIDYFCSNTQSLLSNFIEFMGKTDEYKQYLKKKYENTEQDKDTKKSS